MPLHREKKKMKIFYGFISRGEDGGRKRVPVSGGHWVTRGESAGSMLETGTNSSLIRIHS